MKSFNFNDEKYDYWDTENPDRRVEIPIISKYYNIDVPALVEEDGWNETGFDDTKWDSYDQAVTGGTGSIEYLRLGGDLDLFENSTTGADVYTPIAQFDIKAIGAVNDSVTYALDGDNLGGILADLTTEYRTDLNNVQFVPSESQNVFTIVPEPSSLLILSGLGMIGYLRRKK